MARLRVTPALSRSASALAIIAGIGSATTVNAQETTDSDTEIANEIIVTGVRASLDRSIDLKRITSGIVDGISSEEIGKILDTYLAESLPRITGASSNRVNGEVSSVTFR